MYFKSPRSTGPDDLPTINKIISVTIAAGSATLKFALNLSFMLTFCVLVAAIVVSEITDKLSPNIDPPTSAPKTKATGRPAFCAIPTAIGPTVTIVPTDVPVAIDKKQAITNIPAVMN